MLALALVAAAGIAAMRLPRLALPKSLRLDLLLPAGAPLVLLGLLLGPGIGVLDAGAQRAVAPLTALALGWIGAAFGARFEWRLIRRIPRRRWLHAALAAAAAFVAVAGAAWALTRLAPALRLAWRPLLPTIVALGAIAATSVPGLRSAGRLGPVCGLAAFTLALAPHHPHEPGPALALTWLAWLALAGASGALVGLVFLSVTRLRPNAEALAPLALGVILLGAGVGYAADVSAFIVCALAAALIVNTTPHKRRLQALLAGWEPQFRCICLIVAGALLALPTLWLLGAVPVVSGVSVAAQWVAARFGGARAPVTVAQGSIALALALDFHLAYGGAGGLVTTVLLGAALARVAGRALVDSRAPAGGA